MTVSSLPDLLQGSAALDWLQGFPASEVRFPASPEAVAAAVKEARTRGERLAPAGAGTWLTGGGWIGAADAVLSVGKLDASLHYEPADLTLTVGAGMRMADLSSMVAEHGQWLPLDPPGVATGTVGGMVASGLSGSLRSAYGAVRDNVLGLQCVTGEGRLLNVGGRVVKNVAGYDLVRLLTGSRGSLGVITAVSLRLFPLPEADRTLRFTGGLGDLVTAGCTVARLPVPLASIELDAGSDPRLLVRVLGGEEEVDGAAAAVNEGLAGHGCDREETLDGGESRALHDRRTTWEDGADWVIRCSGLPADLGATLEAGLTMARALDGDVTAHVSQGLVRVKAGLTKTGNGGGSGASAGTGPGPGVADILDVTALAGEALKATGGAVVIAGVPPHSFEGIVRSSPGPVVSLIQERIKALFDPGGVFAGEAPA